MIGPELSLIETEMYHIYFIWFFFSGPFRYLDLHGARPLVDKMLKYQQWYGDEFKPCQLLLDHANDASKKFHKNWNCVLCIY